MVRAASAHRQPIVARKASGEEVSLETAELAVLEGKGNRQSPQELGLLASGSPRLPIPSRQLESKSVSRVASILWDARLRPGIPRSAVPKVRRQNVPSALFQHLRDRPHSHKIAASQLELLAKWFDTEPKVPEGEWYKCFAGITVCGSGERIKTFLLPGQAPRGQRIP